MAYVCGNCVFWHPDFEKTADQKADGGACRRQAPRLRMERSSNDTSAAWPPTVTDDWCGEWRPTTMPLPFDAKVAS